MRPTLVVSLMVVLFGVTQAESPNNPEGYNYDKPTVAFVLPSRQRLFAPQDSYGAPLFAQQRLPSFAPPPQTFSSPENTYGPPEDKYGAPPTELTPPEALDVESREASVLTTTTEMVPTTTEAQQKEAEQIREAEEVEDSSDKEEGVYYIFHPSGLLQRIVYSTKNDLRNMAYSAQFRYKDVEPIRDPVYTYDPETLVLRQILA